MSWLSRLSGSTTTPEPGTGFQKAAPSPTPSPNPTGATGPDGKPASPDDGTPHKEVDPLAFYNNMYTPGKEDEANKPPVFALDDKALDGAVGQIDFYKGLDPEIKQQAEAGDGKAIMAMMDYGNKQAYRHAMQHSSHLTGKFTEARLGFENKGFGSKVRGELTSNALEDTPGFKSPAVRKQLTIVATDFQRQFPEKTPKEIADMSKKYLQDMAAAISGTEASDKKAPAGPTNWDDYFGDEEGQG